MIEINTSVVFFLLEPADKQAAILWFLESFPKSNKSSHLYLFWRSTFDNSMKQFKAILQHLPIFAIATEDKMICDDDCQR